MKAVKRNDRSTSRNVASSSSASSFATVTPASTRRRRVNPVSPPTSLELRGVEVHFPFRPYKCQEDYMGKVLDALIRSENALLESPTGTGKTLCLLCAALAWQRQEARKSQDNPPSQQGPTSSVKNVTHRPPTIIYASRTHSQLSQVVRELRNTRYRPKHAVLGSRDQMCVNPKVKTASSTASEINHDCSKLGKDRKCRFKNKLDGFEPPPIESNSHGTQPVMDIEDLLKMGNTHQVCPFYYTRDLVETAELILLPYNYLFDKDARSSTLSDIPWDNAAIIFDEAHNLESFASESASFDLTTTDIAGCIGEVNRAAGYIQAMPEMQERIKLDNVLKLKSLFLNLEEYILGLDNQNAFMGEYIIEFFEKGASITHANHKIFIHEVQKLSDIFMDVHGGSSRGAPRLEHFVQCIKRVFGEPSEARCFAKAKSYRVHISSKSTNQGNQKNTTGRTVSYWCFAPSESMLELSNLNVRSIIVTSGTLSPLESYALELDLPFPHRLENPHIIPDDHIYVRVIANGVSGKRLTSSYERRNDNEYYTELGNTIVSLAKIVPGGMLIFFPSYSVMEKCIERWGGPASSRSSDQRKGANQFFERRRKTPTGSSRYSFQYSRVTSSSSSENKNPWKRLLGTKAVVVEPKSTADLPDAIAEFHKYLNLEKSTGCVLFGVCRGKISEGIDFAHDMCRAVVITGLPFAPSFDPKVMMKREFLDTKRASGSLKGTGDGGFVSGKNETKISGNEWYTQQAHRAVNQAIGRVIRNKDDYGAILLLDCRFEQPRNQQGLSKWVRPHIQKDEGMGRAISSLVKFYRDAESKTKSREIAQPEVQTPNQVAMILRYQEESPGADQVSPEDDFTKVAIIRNSQEVEGASQATSASIETSVGASNVTSDNASTSYVRPDQIVARLDVRNLDQSRVGCRAKTAAEVNTCVTSASTKDCKNSSGEISNSKPPCTVKSKIETVARSNGTSSKEIAAQFFQLVRSQLTLSEQSSIKKAVISMQKFGQKKDKKSYLLAARDVIRIIVAHETFESRCCSRAPEMMGLFFRLLPDAFRRDTQQIAMGEVFAQSKLGQLCKAHLSPEHYKTSRSSVSKLLFDIWYEENGTLEMVTSLFLKRAQEIMMVFTNALKTHTSDMMKAFVRLMPSDFASITNALIDEISASEKIRRLKEADNSKLGEDSVQSFRFRSRMVPKQEDAPKVQSLNPVQESESNRQTVVVNANESSCLVKKRPNPYSSKNKAVSPCLEKFASSVGAQDMIDEGTQKSLQSQKKPRTSDIIAKALIQSEAGTFFQKTEKHKPSNINSNAPKNLTCPICEKYSTKPFLAECGHMACRECWLKWLRKSKTCPVCRVTTTKESLALAVFENEKGSEMPLTMSQLCAPSPVNIRISASKK